MHCGCMSLQTSEDVVKKHICLESYMVMHDSKWTLQHRTMISLYPYTPQLP